jgi:nucleoside-diphosphate-sugar epimerase
MKHTILGCNGIAGLEVKAALSQLTADIKLVSRTARGNPAITVADLEDEVETINAIKGSDIVYLTAGTTYSTSLWNSCWPKIVANTVKGCIEANAKLIYLDNVYMYGNVAGWMTEETPNNPVSKKGEIRALTAELILDKIRGRSLTATIARSATFLGFSDHSPPNVQIFSKLFNKEKPVLFGNKDAKHSYTYVKDLGKALVLLAHDEKSFNQIWHLPTDRNALTSTEFVSLAAELFGQDCDPVVLDRTSLEKIGEQDSYVNAYIEMMYQNENDYLFDSTKFENAFDFQPTSYRKAIQEILDLYQRQA